MKQRNEIKKRIVGWLKNLSKVGFEILCYRFENDGSGFKMYIDSDIYEVINGYFNDGYNPCGLGSKFESLLDGTGWMMDFESYSVLTFVKDA